MKPLARPALGNVRYVLADMDGTLTLGARLPAAAYDALERLARGGLKVFLATAAPAGWCDQMVRTWPVEGVIGENGGLFFRRGGAYGVLRHFWNGADQRRELFATGQRIAASIPGAALADDQPFRLATLAFDRPRDAATRDAILAAFARAGLRSAQSGRFLLGWTGGFDKRAMAGRVLGDIDHEAICCCGDPGSDAALFDAYPCAIDSGFVAAAEAILSTRNTTASTNRALQRRSSAGNMAK
jgi:haloacid dehalogenase-like hydrolase